MKYNYTWQETHNDLTCAPDYANAHLVITTDSGDLIFEEDYVPLVDLINKIKDWNQLNYVEYSPDDYEDNPLICLQMSDYEVCVGTPDSRADNKKIIVSRLEFTEFYTSFSQEVKRDIEKMLGHLEH